MTARRTSSVPGRTASRQQEIRHDKKSPKGRLFLLSLTALGAVFGDIGTSPLYALRGLFSRPGSLSPEPQNVLEIFSLVFWALLVIVSLAYSR